MTGTNLRKIICFLTVFVVLTVNSPGIYAERYVTVATIGNTPAPVKSKTKQELVDHVISFWTKELKQVLPDKPDLIVLPEFCDLSGEGDEYLAVRKNQVVDFFSSAAKSNHCYIAFGMKRKDSQDLWRNSCVVLDRNGGIAGIYDKNFPTIQEMESGIRAGNQAPVIKCDFGRVAIAICYDLNFDELRMEYAKEKPDLIIFSSMYHGGVAQSMWAYTCRAYFVGSVYRETPSEIRNPMGDAIASSTNYFDYAIARINLDCRLVHLDYNWDRLTALKAKYGTAVSISDPGKLASVLVTSNDSKITADQMINEFGIELLDDYLNRARKFRQSNLTGMQEYTEEGWKDLFDGKTLTGWKVLNQDWTHPGSKPDFYVQDNMIVCNTKMGNEGGYLITDKTYSDFILELDVKIDSSLNSGIQCRGRLWDKDTSSIYVAGDPNLTRHESKWRAGEAWGYQIEVDPSPRAWSGGLYEPCNRGWLVALKGNEPARKAFKPMEWNHFKIIMKGNRIQTWVNDIPVVDTADNLTSAGFIGLQFHGAYYEWQKGKKSLWKNIRIKEL